MLYHFQVDGTVVLFTFMPFNHYQHPSLEFFSFWDMGNVLIVWNEIWFTDKVVAICSHDHPSTTKTTVILFQTPTR